MSQVPATSRPLRIPTPALFSFAGRVSSPPEVLSAFFGPVRGAGVDPAHTGPTDPFWTPRRLPGAFLEASKHLKGRHGQD